MASQPYARKLAAVLAADVVGYSRLMGADETGTHARLKALRTGFIEPKVAEYRGRVVKLTGDGALVEFASAADAVRCAIEIQQGVPDWSSAVPQAERIELRIGINLGDVIIDGDDLYGDGVNVAARLEALAPAGGVSVSDVVHQMVRGHLDVTFADRGEQQIKNIARPVRVWQWTNAVAAPGPSPIDTIGPALPDKPSIAVLPFDNLSRDPEQEYFSDGMTEDLITDLSQISDLLVTARHAVFPYKSQPAVPQQIAKDLGVRYVLELSVRRAASRFRINAQLIDATSGYHLWAERYDRVLDDIFDLQDEITRTIVAVLKVHLAPSEQGSMARRSAESLEAYDLFLRAREHQFGRSRDASAQARELLEKAIAIDPQFAAAYALLAEVHRREWFYEWRDDDNPIDQALKFAQSAVRLDDKLPLAHTMLGWIHVWRKEHEAAIEEARRAVELDPNNGESHGRLGHTLDLAGQPAIALPLIDQAMRLDPHYPLIFLFWQGHALESLEQDRDALAAFKRAIDRNPDHMAVHELAAAACAHVNLLDDARVEAAEVLRLSPGFSIGREAQKLPYKDPVALAHLLDGLRKAGLPE